MICKVHPQELLQTVQIMKMIILGTVLVTTAALHAIDHAV